MKALQVVKLIQAFVGVREEERGVVFSLVFGFG